MNPVKKLQSYLRSRHRQWHIQDRLREEMKKAVEGAGPVPDTLQEKIYKYNPERPLGPISFRGVNSKNLNPINFPERPEFNPPKPLSLEDQRLLKKAFERGESQEPSLSSPSSAPPSIYGTVDGPSQSSSANQVEIPVPLDVSISMVVITNLPAGGSLHSLLAPPLNGRSILSLVLIPPIGTSGYRGETEGLDKTKDPGRGVQEAK